MVVPLVLTVAAAAVAVVAWRHSRRWVGLLIGLVAVCAALVAIRDLPGPVVVGLLITALSVVALITAWPLLARVTRPGARTGEDR